MRQAQTLNSLARAIFFCLCACLLTACATGDPTSLPQLEIEVNGLVKEGMLKSDAVAALSSRGFSCLQEGTSLNPNARGILECTRQRGGFLYTCIHRVWFDFTSDKGAISNLRIFRPPCAGL